MASQTQLPLKKLEAENKEMRRLCHLPEEIIMEIQLRLPPESLIRFKCVCKSWYALISDSSFVHKHLHFNKNRVSSSTSLFLSWYHYEREDVQCLVTISDNNDDQDTDKHIPCFVEYINLSSIIPGMDKEKKNFISAASHCNGMVWLPAVFVDKYVLYNPVIREFKFVPRRSTSGGAGIVVEGFGYDSKANDYKIISIWASSSIGKSIAEVYTVVSNSWREIQINSKVSSSEFCDRGLYCKGVLYWVLTRPDIILSFQLSSDEFHYISPPVPDNVNPFVQHKILVVWNESVALLIQDDESSYIEMWVMDCCHDGVKASWTKMSTIKPISWFYYPIMFWKSDELLMTTDDGGIVSYNLNTKKFRNLPIHGVSPVQCIGDFYMKSLVSVKRGN